MSILFGGRGLLFTLDALCLIYGGRKVSLKFENGMITGRDYIEQSLVMNDEGGRKH